MEFSTKEVLVKSTENILKAIGENSRREGLKKLLNVLQMHYSI